MEKNVVSMVRPGARLFRAGVIAVSLGMLALAGCASTEATPPPAPPAGGSANVNFALDKCEQIMPNMYKCPAIDQPICTPEFQRTDVSCVRVGPKGSVFVTRPGFTQ